MKRLSKLATPSAITLSVVVIALLIRVLILQVEGWLLVVAIAEPAAIIAFGFLGRKYWARAEAIRQRLELEHAQVLSLEIERDEWSDRYTLLQENDTARGSLVEALVHSVGGKLTVIRTAAELLGREALSEDGRKYLAALKVQTQAAKKLISDLLKLDKMESGVIEPRVDQINLGEWLPAIVAAQRPEATEKQQDLICSTESKMPPLLTDASILEDVISELLLNALKYSRSGTEIKAIAGFDTVRQLHVIEISNSGFIPSRERELIWNRFYRIQKDANNPATLGNGLGLFSVRQQVVNLLKGQILLSVKAREQKVLFRVEL